jgi:RimK family alpha-L-glutamate ligase
LKNARHSGTININNITIGEDMTGFLVINHFLKGEKYNTLHKDLMKSAKKFGIELLIKTNQEMIFEQQIPDFVLFWDKDINLALSLEKRGIPVFNSAKSIALCDDKAKTYIALDGIVPQPKTIIAPMSFFNSDYSEFVDLAIKELGTPIVYKECFGSFGEQVHLCYNRDEVLKLINSKPFILQEFISSSNGEDIRVEVVDGKCVASMKRVNKEDFRSNITNGGTAYPYTPTDIEAKTAIDVCKALGLTFGGVDILNGGLVCEVNSNAHIINLKNATGIDISPMIFESIIKKI